LRRRLQPEALSTSDLQRWLRAEKYDVGKAEGRLRTHIKWRADYLPHGRVLEVRRRAGLQPASLPQTWPDWESAGAARLLENGYLRPASVGQKLRFGEDLNGNRLMHGEASVTIQPGRQCMVAVLGVAGRWG